MLVEKKANKIQSLRRLILRGQVFSTIYEQLREVKSSSIHQKLKSLQKKLIVLKYQLKYEIRTLQSYPLPNCFIIVILLIQENKKWNVEGNNCNRRNY